jgi:hypothetical protein
MAREQRGPVIDCVEQSLLMLGDCGGIHDPVG